jgi:RNA polymerase sigma-70 factor (ECF subfamily)
MSRPTAIALQSGEILAATAEPDTDLSQWVGAARDGDTAAADRLYTAVRPRLLRTALALGVDPEQAADLVQETLWSAHRNLRRYDPDKASFEGWLGLILVRRTRNRWRSLARTRRLLEALRVVTPRFASAEAETVEARLTLDRLLGTLTSRQREVVALYEIAGLGADEAARLLGISAAGVRSQARDARRRLSEEATRDRREALS